MIPLLLAGAAIAVSLYLNIRSRAPDGASFHGAAKSPDATQGGSDSGPSPQPSGNSTAAVEKYDYPINVNTAGIDALLSLPGMDADSAYQILHFGTYFGPFEDERHLLELTGIDPALYAKFSAYIRFED